MGLSCFDKPADAAREETCAAMFCNLGKEDRSVVPCLCVASDGIVVISRARREA